jgi:hypothetical protein
MSNANTELDLDFINTNINKYYSKEIENKLKDENLLEIYKDTKSVKKEIKILNDILNKNNIEEKKISKILNEYLINLIPSGTKGVIKGNLFNKEVKNIILNFNFLKHDEYDICFEKKHNDFLTEEIPDFYIYNKKLNKILVGMNQLTLWGGGQQTNRSRKYILDNNINNKNNFKLICIVCNYIQIKSKKNNEYKIFNIGFQKDTLMYINNLENIIKKFFNKEDNEEDNEEDNKEDINNIIEDMNKILIIKND